MGKISGYGEDTGPTSDDYIVTIDTGTGNNKKVKLLSLRGLFSSKRVNTIASGTAPTPNGDNTDLYTITNLGGTAGTTITATIGAPTGTPQDGQVLMLRIKDNGTAQTLNWNAIWRPIGQTLPSTTVPNKVIYVQAIYNGQDTTWDVPGVARQS